MKMKALIGSLLLIFGLGQGVFGQNIKLEKTFFCYSTLYYFRKHRYNNPVSYGF